MSIIKRKPRNIWNTTVRNPLRLKDWLAVLYNSKYHWNLIWKENEQWFAELLHNEWIVQIQRIQDGKESDDVGRKWRSALSQLWFIVHHDSIKLIKSLNANHITENGLLLMNASSLSWIQECFLRSLVTYQIPSYIEENKSYKPFKPLIHLLIIMKELENKTGSSHIFQRELWNIIQLTSYEDDVNTIVSDIINKRKEREIAVNKKKFDAMRYEFTASTKTDVKPWTLKDYSDSNLRYFKVCGLFNAYWKWIKINPIKESLINELLISHKEVIVSDLDYIQALFKWAQLPTDNVNWVTLAIEKLHKELWIDWTSFSKWKNDVWELNQIRYSLEEQFLIKKEIEFADNQKNQRRDIIKIIDIIMNNKYECTLESWEEFSFYKEERPAYLERIIWRSFLALNHLSIPPYECRKFKLDQDLRPISHASWWDADCIFEYSENILVTELTLTENSRQEAAEGEPVRRHVYKHQKNNINKHVIWLFIANKIDTNTSETFRNAVWREKEEKNKLDIVPITLNQFRIAFHNICNTWEFSPYPLINFMKNALEQRIWNEWPERKNKIDECLLK